MNKALFLFVLLFATTNHLKAHAEDLKADEIMKKSRKAIKLDGSESLAILNIYNAKGQKRVRKTATISKLYNDGQTEKRLIRFVSPADVKGTGFLTLDYENKTDDMWLFMPALRKTRKIVATEKAKSFMGSEFSYADLTPPRVEDFQHKLVKSEQVGGEDCWVIEAKPKNDDIADENGFSKKVSYIAKADFIIRKALYYDLDEELHKEMEVLKVQEIDPVKHRYRPMHMKITNKQNQRWSEFKLEKIQLRREIPDEYFSIRYLERS